MASLLLSGLWAAGWWAFWGAGLFPTGSPAARSPVYSPGPCPRGLQPGCSEIFIGISIKTRAMGVLRAFRSHFIGAGLPGAAGSSHFQGNLVSRLGLHSAAFVFGLAAPGLACLILTSCLGVCGLSVDEVAQGSHFPTAAGTQTELCVRLGAGGMERVQAPPGLGGNALEFEDIKMQIKTTPNHLHLGNPNWLVGTEWRGLHYYHLLGDPEEERGRRGWYSARGLEF